LAAEAVHKQLAVQAAGKQFSVACTILQRDLYDQTISGNK
jgi:hypothetical protein